MVCEEDVEEIKEEGELVLILVLMEDGLRERRASSFLMKECFVLILVLMEDGLREFQSNWVWNQLQFVLILVLMEDGLREGTFVDFYNKCYES